MELTHEKLCAEMQRLFGDNIVNPEVYPRIFSYQVFLAKWMIEKEQDMANKQS